MEAYENKSNLIDLSEYVRIFKELLEKVSNKFYNLFKNKEINDTDFDLKYKTLVNEILETTNEIAQALKTFYIVEIEYDDFVEIEKIIKDVITDESKCNEKNFEIISKLLKRFKEITDFKFKIIQESIKEGNTSLNNISPDLKEKFEEEYYEFKVDHLYCKLDFYSGYKTGIDTAPFFEEFKDDLME